MKLFPLFTEILHHHLKQCDLVQNCKRELRKKFKKPKVTRQNLAFPRLLYPQLIEENSHETRQIKVLCCTFLFSFLALMVHKTQNCLLRFEELTNRNVLVT